MTEPTVSADLRVLHIVSTSGRRGAEVFASDLVHELGRGSCLQAVAILDGSSDEVAFDAPTFPLTPGQGNMARVLSVPRLLSLVRSMKPNVVVAHGGRALMFATMVASPRSIIYRRIGGSPPKLEGRLRWHFFRRQMLHTARVVAVAESIRRETIEQFGLQPHRVVTIPNGVNHERIAPKRARDEVRASLGISGSTPVILSVGALSWEKDPLTHLEVAQRLSMNRTGLVHLMVGDGPMRNEVLAHASVNGRVTQVLGSRSDIGDLMIASDVLLFASRPEGMEGMPGVAIEAAMLSLPLAGYEVAGIGEVVRPCSSGLLVSPGDIDGLTVAAARLLDDQKIAARIRTDASRGARAFDIAEIAPRYANLCWEVVQGR